jgi:hypothetical protein
MLYATQVTVKVNAVEYDELGKYLRPDKAIEQFIVLLGNKKPGCAMIEYCPLVSLCTVQS